LLFAMPALMSRPSVMYCPARSETIGA
jgi:hypothetical protein